VPFHSQTQVPSHGGGVVVVLLVVVVASAASAVSRSHSKGNCETLRERKVPRMFPAANRSQIQSAGPTFGGDDWNTSPSVTPRRRSRRMSHKSLPVRSSSRARFTTVSPRARAGAATYALTRRPSGTDPGSSARTT